MSAIETTTQTYTIWFESPDCTDQSLVGGKGLNLGRLANAGFSVPNGFVVATGAYMAHIADLRDRISDALGRIGYEDAEALERAVEQIRSWIIAAQMPADIADAITDAYAELGDVYVAVRSSGTAEDLEGASFAGLHDTYLDIRGAGGVLDAVKRDWASLWTARAVAYRKSGGFTEFPSIAVVVQRMVASEVSGVMFTGNPLNEATDEIVLNASWGLGEAVVQGITTPDEYVVRHADLAVLDKTMGGKEVETVRDPDTGHGTVERDTDEARRGEFTLSDERAIELARVGIGIQELYEGFPQDIEWAFADGQFYVLQARPVTGVAFSWDADVTYSVQGNDDPEAVPYDNIWSRVFPEEMWTGAISPLMFSWRCWGLNQCHSLGVHAFGYPEQGYHTRRLWRYHKGVSYYNPEADRHRIKESIPPQLRAGMLHKIPTDWHAEVIDAPFDWGRYMNMFRKVETERPDMGFNWYKHLDRDFISSIEYREATRPRTPAEREVFTDEELKQHLADVIRLEISSYDPPWNGLLWYMGEALGWIGWICAMWYTGDRENPFIDLFTGTRRENIVGEEARGAWELTDMITRSPELRSLLQKYPDERFFEFLDQCIDGPAFRAKYERYVAERGHRGHPDRDIYFDRRADNVMVDLVAWPGMLGAPDPKPKERETRARLEATYAHVHENLLNQDNGVFKAQLFATLFDFAHYSLEYRDNEREVMDWSTYDIKLCFEEVGRRCVERGGLRELKECYFLTMEELYEVLEGTENKRLTRAKIDARRRNFDSINTGERDPAPFLQRSRPSAIDEPEISGDGVFQGKGTSAGKITGTARVVHELKQIGRVKQGDILIVHATDPGWMPVFGRIHGIVLESGGLISHGAIIAREFGLPAAQLPGARRLIPDGATITLNGDSGVIQIHEGDDAEQIAAEIAAMEEELKAARAEHDSQQFKVSVF
ncbi:MAG: PEP/pyruvate-binding domain-containing protein [Solirubrobacteraceae bacterium]